MAKAGHANRQTARSRARHRADAGRRRDGGGVIVSQTAWFKNWLRGYIVREANQYLNGTLSIERLGGNLFFGVELENIGVSMDGSQVVAVKDLGLDYNVFELITQGPVGRQHPAEQAGHLPAARRRHLVAQPPGQEAGAGSRSRRARPARSRSTRSASPTARSSIDEPVGTSGVEVPKRFDHLDAKLAFKYEPVRYSIEITHSRSAARSRRSRSTRCRAASSVKDDTVFVEKLALRTAEIVAVGRRRRAALSDEADVQPADHRRTSCRCRSSRSSCRRSPASSSSRRSS